MALIMTLSRVPLLECDDVYEDEAKDAFYTRAPAPDQEREMIAADMGYTSSSSDPCGPQLGHYLEEHHKPNNRRSTSQYQLDSGSADNPIVISD